MTNKVMLMLSGGIDSTVMAHKLKAEGKKVRGVHLNVGQSHVLQDRLALNKLSIEQDIPIDYFDIPGLVDPFKGYLQDGFEGPSQIMCETSRPFIAPMTIASVYSDTIGYKSLGVAYLQEELDEFALRYANLSDVHSHMQAMINSGREQKFQIETPFQHMSKVDVIRLGQQLEVPMEATWSCWFGKPEHCGECTGCKSRKRAFAESGVPDATAYAN